ncbi:hypothetical protein OAT16_09970 [Prolixibacteraceae bacterium]|nr:hypothetical protein [Prolixibacteraceae bacterium]
MENKITYTALLISFRAISGYAAMKSFNGECCCWPEGTCLAEIIVEASCPSEG